MKKKILIALSLIALIVGYSCQEDLGLAPIEQDVGTVGLSVGKLNAESARFLFDKMNGIVELPSWQREEDCNDPNCQTKHTNGLSGKDSVLCEHDSCTHHGHEYTHNYNIDKQMLHKARSTLPELKKSNIRMEWDNVREWSDTTFNYVEVPLNTGGKLYALKKWQKKDEKMQNERSKVECMLVFQQKRDSSRVECYMITLIGTKEYLKKGKNEVKELRHRPYNSKFTGFVYKSTLNGHIRQGWYYTDGKITHKVFSRQALKNRVIPENAIYYKMDMIDLSVNASTYSADWEYYQCPFCNEWHNIDDYYDCDVVIEYCSNCNQPVDDCDCCYYCGQSPCQCCYRCWEYPCICYKLCSNCGLYPCECCSICHSYPCTCEDSETNCPGPKCPVCAGLINDNNSSTRAASPCLVCSSKECPICQKRHCKEIHTLCDLISNAQALKNTASAIYNAMRSVVADDPRYYSYADFENALSTNGMYENAISLSYYPDEDVYRLADLKRGTSTTSVEVVTSFTTVSTIHSHPNKTPPSGVDLLDLAGWYTYYSICESSYIYTEDGIYMLYVEDGDKVKSFYAEHAGSASAPGASVLDMFKSGTELSKIWIKAYGTDFRDFSNGNERHMMALAELLRQTDSGIRILKKEKMLINFDVYSTIVRNEKIVPINCK